MFFSQCAGADTYGRKKLWRWIARVPGSENSLVLIKRILVVRGARKIRVASGRNLVDTTRGRSNLVALRVISNRMYMYFVPSGVVLVVFGILVLVHGASLGGSGAGLWAGAGALVAGALGVVATLATSSTKTNSAFSSAHLASSLIALALSNMAAITALTAVVRDSQRTPEVSLLSLSVRSRVLIRRKINNYCKAIKFPITIKHSRPMKASVGSSCRFSRYAGLL